MLTAIIIAIWTIGVSGVAALFFGIGGGACFGALSVTLPAIIYRLLTLRKPKPRFAVGILSTVLSLAAAGYIWASWFDFLVFRLGGMSEPLTDGGQIACSVSYMLSIPAIAIIAAVFGSGIGQGFRSR